MLNCVLHTDRDQIVDIVVKSLLIAYTLEVEYDVHIVCIVVQVSLVCQMPLNARIKCITLQSLPLLFFMWTCWTFIDFTISLGFSTYSWDQIHKFHDLFSKLNCCKQSMLLDELVYVKIELVYFSILLDDSTIRRGFTHKILQTSFFFIEIAYLQALHLG